MVDEGGRARFLGEVLALNRIVLKRNSKSLESDRTIQIDIDGGVDRSHATLPEERDNTKVIEEGSGFERKSTVWTTHIRAGRSLRHIDSGLACGTIFRQEISYWQFFR